MYVGVPGAGFDFKKFAALIQISATSRRRGRQIKYLL